MNATRQFINQSSSDKFGRHAVEENNANVFHAAW